MDKKIDTLLCCSYFEISLYTGKLLMFFNRKERSSAVFRRDWGADANQPITKLEVALDAITPSNDDCSMRIIYREAGLYAVSIAFYSDIYFSPPIKSTHHVSLSTEVVCELTKRNYLIPFSLSGSNKPTMWVVSDEGEAAWAALIGH